ncbi:MAG: histidine kinase, partial [Planctomycetota bacterium]
AHKLEAVGQLASGIAHEINTPMQYIGDNVRFLRDAFGDLMGLIGAYAALREAAERDRVLEQPRKQVEQAEAQADVEFLQEEVEPAIEQTLEGVDHVTGIVRALKEFAHPGDGEWQEADLRKALENALALGRNAYKLVADIETDYGELPPVRCKLAELNQVFLNLIVNAAHAIEEVVAGTEQRGTIRIRTRRDGAFAHVEIADTGCGIPHEIRERIFDPFFTTKGVGRGTGQGLAIAYQIVVKGHGGELRFDSEPGCGTTFHIRLPIAGPSAASEA